MNLENLFLFSSIAFIATITPGPAIMLVSVNSIVYGVKSSMLTILGNITGLFAMSLLAILGLSTVILHSAHIFFAVKIIGALYLIYLGIKLWRNGFMTTATTNNLVKSQNKPSQPHKLYLQGLMVALSNPKAIAFTTALFPQFIQSELPLTAQFMTLVSIFMLLSFSCLLGYAVLAAKAKHRSEKLWLQKLIGKLFGTAFIGSGVALAVATQK